jgi:hypothetical protein
MTMVAMLMVFSHCYPCWGPQAGDKPADPRLLFTRGSVRAHWDYDIKSRGMAAAPLVPVAQQISPFAIEAAWPHDSLPPHWKAKTEAKFSEINREIRVSEFQQALATEPVALRRKRLDP